MSRLHRDPTPSRLVATCFTLASRFQSTGADSHHLVFTGPSPAAAFLWIYAVSVASDNVKCTELSKLLEDRFGSLDFRKLRHDELRIEMKLLGFMTNVDEFASLPLLQRLVGDEDLQWPKQWPFHFVCRVPCGFPACDCGSVKFDCSISFHNKDKPVPLTTYLHLSANENRPAMKAGDLSPTTLLGQSLIRLHRHCEVDPILHDGGPALEAVLLLTNLLDIVVNHHSGFPALNGFPIETEESHLALNKIMDYQLYTTLSRWVATVRSHLGQHLHQLEKLRGSGGSKALILDLQKKLTAFDVVIKIFPKRDKAIFEGDGTREKQSDHINFSVYPAGSYTAVSRTL